MQPIQIRLDLCNSLGIIVFTCEHQQIFCIAEAGSNRCDGLHYRFELCAFASKCLSAFGLVPDIGLFEFPVDFGQSIAAFSEVKGTPSRLRGALACL